MIRVLQDLSALDGGGVAKLLYDYYRNMDHNEVRFDFMIYNFYDEGIYEKPLREMGCTIYKLPAYSQNPKECHEMQEKIIANGKYDVIHTHFGIGGFRVLKIAKQYGIPKRIVHSHIAFEPYSLKTRAANIIKRFLNKHYATELMACGNDAGAFMWGNTEVKYNKVHIMKNAIDTQKFQFNDQVRLQKRNELGINDKFVVGIVGRLSEQKNYPFLFRVYEELLKMRNDVILLVIGRGLEEQEIKALADSMGISDKIMFLGIRDDVPELLNALDIFVLPSLYEGLPVVLVEAQANGLTEIVADTITKEMDITDLIQFLPINNTEKQWAEAINGCKENISKRAEYAKIVADSGYDIRTASKEMENFYKS